MAVRRVPWVELREDFLRLTSSIVWAVVTTVDPAGRPRGRILHPVWVEDDDGPVGWVATRPTPVKRADIASHPHVACSYWTPAHDGVFVDCEAGWVPDDRRRATWELIAAAPPPVGYDPAPMWPDGPDAPGFAALRLAPFRIRIALAAETARGLTDRLWTRSSG